MDLGNPAATLVSPLEGRVLDALNGTTLPLSGREIHRIAGAGSAAGVWKVLNRLEQQGVVTAERRPRLTHYVANRDHLAWPSVEALVGLRSALFEHIRGEISNWPLPSIHASVFGSAARRDADAASDVDLLLIREDSLSPDQIERWEAQLADLRQHVRSWTGNACQTLALTRGRVLEHLLARDPIVDNWRKDTVLLAGDPISRFI